MKERLRDHVLWSCANLLRTLNSCGLRTNDLDQTRALSVSVKISLPNIPVIHQDTQYLMINFIHKIQELNMFRTSIVHLQEQFGMSRYVLGRIETYQIATYSIRTLLKMDYWSPKHVELPNVINKINHQILCILLDYRYTAKWYTVYTISKVYQSSSHFTKGYLY